MTGARRIVWSPSPQNRPVSITWTCGACGHTAIFGPAETVYDDDPRWCGHGPKAPRYPNGALIYQAHTADAHFGHHGTALGLNG